MAKLRKLILLFLILGFSFVFAKTFAIQTHDKPAVYAGNDYNIFMTKFFAAGETQPVNLCFISKDNFRTWEETRRFKGNRRSALIYGTKLWVFYGKDYSIFNPLDKEEKPRHETAKLEWEISASAVINGNLWVFGEKEKTLYAASLQKKLPAAKEGKKPAPEEFSWNQFEKILPVESEMTRLAAVGHDNLAWLFWQDKSREKLFSASFDGSEWKSGTALNAKLSNLSAVSQGGSISLFGTILSGDIIPKKLMQHWQFDGKNWIAKNAIPSELVPQDWATEGFVTSVLKEPDGKSKLALMFIRSGILHILEYSDGSWSKKTRLLKLGDTDTGEESLRTTGYILAVVMLVYGLFFLVTGRKGIAIGIKDDMLTYFIKRTSAFILDVYFLVFPLLFFLQNKILFINDVLDPASAGAKEGLILSAIVFSYYSITLALFEGIWGQTIGKRLMGLIVVRIDGTPCTIAGALIRNILRPLDALPYPILPIPYLTGIITLSSTERRQRIGDIIGKTMVVRADEDITIMKTDQNTHTTDINA